MQRLSEAKNSIPDDSFLDQLVRCQSSRLEDQRSPLPAPLVDTESEAPITQNKSGSTVPDEDFFSLIMRFQSGRMDDQRATIPNNNQRFNKFKVFSLVLLLTNFVAEYPMETFRTFLEAILKIAKRKSNIYQVINLVLPTAKKYFLSLFNISIRPKEKLINLIYIK